MGLRTTIAFLVVALLCGAVPTRAQTMSDAADEPAILLCPKNKVARRLDFDALRRLEKEHGLRIDYLEDWSAFGWDRIAQYNALMLFGVPYERHGQTWLLKGPTKGPGFDETTALLKRYLEQGGGVMLNIDRAGRNADAYDATQRALERYDAKLPMEVMEVPPTDRAPHPRLRNMRFMYTRNVVQSPVSTGVKAIWWPSPREGKSSFYTRYSGPLEVENEWRVVVRGAQGSESVPYRPPGWENMPEARQIEDVYQRPDGVAEPPLFAIRNEVHGAGRLALFHCMPVFHVRSGTKWVHDGAMLNKGLQGKTSDFERLLGNTFSYLAEPSLGSADLGGAEIAGDRLVPPPLRQSPEGNTGPRTGDALREVIGLAPPQKERTRYRGFVGARTVRSGGEGTVKAYAAEARKQGLDFVVFLEKFSKLSPDELEALSEECLERSDEDLLLLPGYRMRANTGNRMLFYGKRPVYPSEKVLSNRSEDTFMLQGEKDDGSFTKTRVPSLTFLLNNFMGDARASMNNVGFFDFKRRKDGGALQLYHAKGFGAGAVMFYEDGGLVEDATDQYLRTNAGAMSCVPLAVDLVDSPKQLASAVEAGHALTHATASSMEKLPRVLSKNHQYEAKAVSVSSGPAIRAWPEMARPWVYGSEWFVNGDAYKGRGLMAAELHVTSDVGLSEVRLYQGERLFRRFKPKGEKELHKRLFLSALMQNNLSVVAIDTEGGKAVSFPRHSRKAGERQQVSYCGDHVNSGHRMARGVHSWRAFRYPHVPEAGHTWDGGPKGWRRIVHGGMNPKIADEEGVQQATIYQYPVMDFADEGTYRGRSIQTGTTSFGGNPWRGWGPIQETPLYDGRAVITEFGQYTHGVDPTMPAVYAKEGGSLATLYKQVLTFKKSTTLTKFKLNKIPGHDADVEATVFTGQGTDLHQAYQLSSTSDRRQSHRLTVDTGEWFAVGTHEMGNCFLAFNRGAALELQFRPGRFEIAARMPEGGMVVEKGDTHRVELLTITWPLDIRFGNSGAVLSLVDYLQSPDGLAVERGARVRDAKPGLLDLRAQNGAVEARMPNPKKTGRVEMPPTSLAARVRGLRARWSAGYYQLRGYNGKNFYTDGSDVYRPVGVGRQGRIYLPLYPQKASEETHFAAGHPVVARGEHAERLFVQVTPLTGHRRDEDGHPLWHVSVNNPTDEAVEATLEQAMDLPSLNLETRKIRLASGEYRVLLHETPER